MSFIGIDPGVGGGMVQIDRQGEFVEAMPFDESLQDMAEWISSRIRGTVVIEKVGATPQMGVVSAFTFGKAYGIMLGLVAGAGHRIVHVTPQQWQKEFALLSKNTKLGATEKKQRNRARAQELFPGVKVTNKIADALLLAEWGRRRALEWATKDAAERS